ncbi:zinc dependent phospholipase C family protein [Salinithrix halophila]|uniref:Zinc dependent phospholipase C family protein n=1 Tax=Salinithrix halophila TaxID=1485204 RepID=A0ABV8JIU1_9BACL
MPNVWSHILFGRAALKHSGSPLPSDPNPFHLGCQGPDFLLYHHFWPWKRGHEVSSLGSAIHRDHCGPFLLDLIDAAVEHPGMRDYVSGFLTHYILDRRTHPYIVYRSGDGKYKHQKLEVIIDTLLAERLEGIRTWKTPVVPWIIIGSRFPRQWVEVLQWTALKHFPEEAGTISPEDWNQAYRDMLKALRFFFDPWGIKWLLTLGYISPFRYRPVHDGNDYLNERQTEWLHPAQPEEKHRESFLMLWESALTEASDLLQQTQAFWKRELSLETLSTHIGDLSYDTGKPSSSGMKNQIAEPIV